MTTLLRGACGVGVVGLLATAALGPDVVDASGFPAAPAAFVLSAVIALCLVAAGLGRDWWRAAAWLGLLIAGAAAHLQLIDAGPRVAYQHVDVLRLPTAWSWLAVGVLGLQIVLVTRSLRGLQTKWSWLLARAGPVGFTLGGLFLVSVAAVPSASPTAYGLEIVLSFGLQLVHLATLLLALRELPIEATDRLAAWLDRPGAHSIPREVWIAAAGLTLVAALLSVVVYEAHPHVPDEFVYLLPARYFAEGVLALPAPPVADGFDVDLMVNDGTRWYSPVPPGWPAVLALGAFVGLPWLVNPVLGGLSVLLTWSLVSRVYDARAGRLAALLLAMSPWLVFMSMSFMTHVLTLACALIAAVVVEQARRTGALWTIPLGGAAIGWIGLTRPLDAVAAAIVVGVYLVWTGTPRLRLGPTLVLALSSLGVAALTLPYNRLFTGSATEFPLMAYTDAQYGEGTNALGFGANRGIGWPGLDPFPGHGAVDVVVNAMLNLSAINIELLGWATGSLVLVTLVAVSPRRVAADVGMLGAAVLVAALHSFYWFSGGPDFGARYWFLAIVPLIALTARGSILLDTEDSSAKSPRGRAAAACLLLSFTAVVSFLPWRAFDKYHHYRGMDAGIQRLAEQAGFGRDLVFIRGDRHPDYVSAAYYNPLDWHADAPIYAWDRSPSARSEVIAAYPDRPVWFVEGPTVTGGGFRVVEGPIPPAARPPATGP